MDHHKRKFDEDVSQEKEDAPFKREKVLDAKYKFSFNLEPDDEFDEYIQNVSGKVKYEGSTIGRLSAYLFERHNGFAEGFYDICDAPSAETQECSVLFFKDTGKLKGDFAHKASPTCNSGGYLHIVSVEVDEAHRGQGLGLTLLQKCLDHLAGSWTIAMMQPYPLHEKGEAFTRAVVAMGRHFARLGFQKCDTNSASERAKFWFLEGCRYTGQVLHKESVRDLEVILPLSQPTVTEVCEELRKIITRGAGEMTHDLNALSAAEEANFKEKMAAVLARGASLDECGALHVAVANKICHYLRPLIDLGANINHADHAGNTPLHVAACGFDHRGATLLLQLGADKKVKNSTGQTAAQLARDSRCVLSKTSIFRDHLGDADLTISALK